MRFCNKWKRFLLFKKKGEYNNIEIIIGMGEIYYGFENT